MSQNRWLGGLLGLAGGIAGLVAMKYAMQLAGKLGLEAKREPEQPPAPARRYEAALRGQPEPKNGGGKARSISLVGDLHEPGEVAPAALGRNVYQKLFGRRPGDRTHERLGMGVHLGYGLLMAAGYGAMRAGRPGIDLLGGLAFALGLFALGDELAVPLLGLADSPTEAPLREHGKYLAAHVAYGVATAAATQGLAHLARRVRD
jgi:hypothetical protein